MLDAFVSAGGSVPAAGLKVDREALKLRAVDLGGPKVRKSRSSFTDTSVGAMRGCIVMSLFVLCSLKAVLNSLGGIARAGATVY